MSNISLPDSKVPYIRPPFSEVTRKPLPYTGTPWKLFGSDVLLFLKNFFYLPWIFLPAWPWPSGGLDELFPSPANLLDISIHSVLFFTQLGFLISLFTFTFLPTWAYFGYIATFLLVNKVICFHFNRDIPDGGLPSTEDFYSRQWPQHNDEYWIFLNGICVGRNWLQHNVDRIARTFHRPVVGVHNKTDGVIFDLVQCLIQRALLYATQDVRDLYLLVKAALLNPDKKKVVLILHSQGGIEGGMIVDWLLDEMPAETLQKLEIYTFGNLANHFSNPSRGEHPETGKPVPAIPHIEHYANDSDFACRFGVLNFARHAKKKGYENRFMGQVFVNRRGGHQLNQHYLDGMFPLDPTLRFARKPEPEDFMNQEVRVNKDGSLKKVTRGKLPEGVDVHRANSSTNGELSDEVVPRIKDLSRLWQYRNGNSPAE
ncbi:hypothetical protein ACJ41O_006235 [Fusarium nematophilum]